MNCRVSTTSAGRPSKAWHLLFFLFLPGLTTEVGLTSSAEALGEDGFGSGYRGPSRPYLRFVGPPPLRFEEAKPPPDLASRPPGTGPALPEVPSETARTPAAPVQPVQAPKSPTQAPVAPKPQVLKETTPATGKPDGPPTPTPTILPDEDRQQVKPEDFLPYFQLPPSGNSGAPGAPGTPAAPGADAAPREIPSSSSTYNQQ
jgi:hypothetical protein